MNDQSGQQPSHQYVRFESNGKTAHGYLVEPAAGSGAGLIVIQEWWGLDDHIADVARRFAGEGFVVLAPDLYGGRVTHDEAEALKLMQQLPPADAVADLSGAVDYLLAQPCVTGQVVGVVGFCMGGAFALRLAATGGERVSAAVVFYGAVNPDEDLSGIRAAIQGHFGEFDQGIAPQRAREEMAQVRTETGVTVETYFYEAGHAFFNDQDPLGTYNAVAAELAWARTLEFLQSHLG